MNKNTKAFTSFRHQSGFSLFEVCLAVAVVACTSSMTLESIKEKRFTAAAEKSVEQLNALPKAMVAAPISELENQLNQSVLFPGLVWHLEDERNGVWKANLRVENEPKLCLMLGAHVHLEKARVLVPDWNLVAVNGSQASAKETLEGLEECAKSEEVVFSFLIKGQGEAAVSVSQVSAPLPSVDLDSFSSDSVPKLKSWNGAGGF